jgi:alpha-tubulin suppressor-like RCC1 family protein
VVAVTADHEVYAWGSGGNGRLGHGNDESKCVPVLVSCVPESFDVMWCACGNDGTFLVSASGKLLACGSNRHNKLGLMATDKAIEQRQDVVSADEVHSFLPIHAEPLRSARVM